jgi:hypothetical protein
MEPEIVLFGGPNRYALPPRIAFKGRKAVDSVTCVSEFSHDGQ